MDAVRVWYVLAGQEDWQHDEYRATIMAWVSAGHQTVVFEEDSRVDHEPVWDESGAYPVVRYSTRFPDQYAIYLAAAAKRAEAFARAIVQAIDRFGPPDVIDVMAADGLAHLLLQRRLTGDPLLSSVKVVVSAGIPKFMMRTNASRYRLPGYWFGEMERFQLQAADHVIYASEGIQQAIGHEYLPIDGDVVASPVAYLPGPRRPLSDVVLVTDADDRAERVVRQAIEKMSLPVSFNVWRLGDGDRGPEMSEGFCGLSSLNTAGTIVLAAQWQFWPVLRAALMVGKLILLLPGPAWSAMQDWVRDHQTGYLCSTWDWRMIAARLHSVITLTDPEQDEIQEAIRGLLARMDGPASIVEYRERIYRDVVNYTTPKIFPFVRPSLSVSHDVQPLSRPSLSVVLPYYNLGQYVQEAIDSMVGASHPPDEILIINDGSTDPVSVARLYEIEQQFSTVRVLHQDNLGVVAARNTGIEEAKGDVVALLDADDRVHPKYFERALGLMTRYSNVHFVGSWVQYFGSGHGMWAGWNPEPPYLLYHNLVNASGLIVRRDTLREFGMGDPTMSDGYEDYEVVVRMVAAGRRGVVIPERLFYYRVRPASRSKADAGPLRWESLYERLTRQHEVFYQQYAVEVINLLNANGPQYHINTPLGALPDDP